MGDLSITIFGFSKQNIEVDVPARLAHRNRKIAPAPTSSAVTGGIDVHSHDGHIALTDVQGIVDAHSDDGYIDANNVRGDQPRGRISSDGAASALQNVAVERRLRRADAATPHRRGRSVSVTRRRAPTKLPNDGRFELELAPNADLTVDASTARRTHQRRRQARPMATTRTTTIKLGSGYGLHERATARRIDPL